MNAPRWLFGLLATVGAVTAILAVVVLRIAGAPFFDYLAGSAILALWAAFLLYVDQAKKHFNRVEGMIQSIGSPSATLERGTLLRLLRSGAFDGCSIDAEFWAYHGRTVLADATRGDGEKIEGTLAEMRTATVEVAGEEVIYQYMHTLLRSIYHRRQRYLAVTTPSELTKMRAKEFILQLSKLYPETIQRVLAVPDEATLRDLPKATAAALREVNDVVEMKYIIMDASNVENFGIYGGVAVGQLDEGRWTNKFTFDPGLVRQKNDEFGGLWSRAKTLSDEILGG
jgi:hypothetical protein